MVDRQYTKFIILANPRTGSTLLTTSLHNNFNIVTHAEVFNDSECNLSPFLSEHKMKQEDLIKKRDKSPIDFLEKYVFREYPIWKKAVGFKILYDQAKIAGKEIWGYLKEDRSIKVIHLVRNNSLDVYCSLQLALKTDIWAQTTNEQTEKVVISLDYDECKCFFNMIRDYQNHYNNFFKDHKMLMINYSELSEQREETLKQVQEFIGVDVIYSESKLKKQNTSPLSEIIENYDELKLRFSNTEWSHFFIH